MFSFSFEHMGIILKFTRVSTLEGMTGKVFYSMCYKILKKSDGFLKNYHKREVVRHYERITPWLNTKINKIIIFP